VIWSETISILSSYSFKCVNTAFKIGMTMRPLGLSSRSKCCNNSGGSTGHSAPQYILQTADQSKPCRGTQYFRSVATDHRALCGPCRSRSLARSLAQLSSSDELQPAPKFLCLHSPREPTSVAVLLVSEPSGLSVFTHPKTNVDLKHTGTISTP
jgi:hypothetical protein